MKAKKIRSLIVAVAAAVICVSGSSSSIVVVLPVKFRSEIFAASLSEHCDLAVYLYINSLFSSCEIVIACIESLQ